ncbi:MAG: FG-GAP-like repeat-containing protein [Planctomycetota bacterium]
MNRIPLLVALRLLIATVLIACCAQSVLAGPGLLMECFEHRNARQLGDIDFDRAPDATRTIADVDFSNTGGDNIWPGHRDHFGVKITGFIRIPRSGDWTFYLRSDDGSRLWLDGAEVINNDGAHSARTRSTTRRLDAGTYPIEIRMFERTGRTSLELDWLGPGVSSRTTIPASQFFTGGYGFTNNPPDRFVRVSGSDNNDGLTPQTAWRTLQKAVSEVQPGQTVAIGAGTYADPLRLIDDGDGESAIRFIGDTQGEVTGDAGSVVIAAQVPLTVTQSQNIVLESLTLIGRSGANSSMFRAARDITLYACTLTGGRRLAWLDDGSAGVLFESCTFSQANDNAISVHDAQVELVDCTVHSGRNNGVLVNHASASVVLRRTTIQDSRMRGIRVERGALLAENCLIVGNRQEGIFVNQADASAIASHCTFVDNKHNARVDGGSLTVANSILVDAVGYGFVHQGGSASLVNSLLDGNRSGSVRGFTLDPSNIETDPEFADTSFRLADTSPAIDAPLSIDHLVGSDISGGPRPVGTGSDMGCHEYGGGSPVATLPYTTGFEGAVDRFWSSNRRGVTEATTSFLGNFGRVSGGPDNGQESAEITFEVIPGETYMLRFDLLAFDSWDGASTRWGPDSFRVLLDDEEIFLETVGSSNASIEAPREQLGRVFGGGWNDHVYRDLWIEFVPSGSRSTLKFIGGANQSRGDESWGIDNVFVGSERDALELLPMFTDVTVAMNAGVDASGNSDDAGPPIVTDFDHDGDQDVLLTGRGTSVLLENRVEDGAGTPFGRIDLGLSVGHRQSVVADLDGDGLADLWAARSGLAGSQPNALVNRGGLSFDTLGDLDFTSPSNCEAAAAIDANRDGRLDVLMLSEGGNHLALGRIADPTSGEPVLTETRDTGELDLVTGNGDYCSTADIDGDGNLDVFYHLSGGVLFYGNGDGTFTAETGQIGVHVSNSAKFGSAWADYDNDGDMDLFAADARSGQPSRLFRNDGGGSFAEVGVALGLTDTGQHRSVAWGDYDHDGDLDLFITTASGPNLLYRNTLDPQDPAGGTPGFEAAEEGLSGNAEALDGLLVDLDNDGDLDAVITQRGAPAQVHLNRLNDERSLRVRVVGAGPGGTNTLGVGVRVELWDDSGDTLLGVRELGTARGFGGVKPLIAHFGGTDPDTPYLVRVRFNRTVVDRVVTPSAVSTAFGAQTVDRLLTIEEPPSAVRPRMVRWSERGHEGAIIARLRAMAVRRGMMERGSEALRQIDTMEEALAVFGASHPDEVLRGEY